MIKLFNSEILTSFQRNCFNKVKSTTLLYDILIIIITDIMFYRYKNYISILCQYCVNNCLI